MSRRFQDVDAAAGRFMVALMAWRQAASAVLDAVPQGPTTEAREAEILALLEPLDEAKDRLRTEGKAVAEAVHAVEAEVRSRVLDLGQVELQSRVYAEVLRLAEPLGRPS